MLVHVFEHSDDEILPRGLLRVVAVVSNFLAVEDAVVLVSDTETDRRVVIPDQIGSQSIVSGKKREELQFKVVVVNPQAEQVILPGLSGNLLSAGQKI